VNHRPPPADGKSPQDPSGPGTTLGNFHSAILGIFILALTLGLLQLQPKREPPHFHITFDRDANFTGMDETGVRPLALDELRAIRVRKVQLLEAKLADACEQLALVEPEAARLAPPRLSY
jgi:hypothetical protein